MKADLIFAMVSHEHSETKVLTESVNCNRVSDKMLSAKEMRRTRV